MNLHSHAHSTRTRRLIESSMQTHSHTHTYTIHIKRCVVSVSESGMPSTSIEMLKVYRCEEKKNEIRNFPEIHLHSDTANTLMVYASFVWHASHLLMCIAYFVQQFQIILMWCRRWNTNHLKIFFVNSQWDCANTCRLERNSELCGNVVCKCMICCGLVVIQIRIGQQSEEKEEEE